MSWLIPHVRAHFRLGDHAGAWATHVNLAARVALGVTCALAAAAVRALVATRLDGGIHVAAEAAAWGAISATTAFVPQLVAVLHFAGVGARPASAAIAAVRRTWPRNSSGWAQPPSSPAGTRQGVDNMRLWILLLGALVVVACNDVSVSSSPTPKPTLAPSTATPTPDAWAGVEGRALRLPTVESGSGCPVSSSRQLQGEHQLAIGGGPIYLFRQYAPTETPQGVFTAYPDLQVGASGLYLIGADLWGNDSDYLGPAIIRGSSIDGNSSVVRFDAGYQQDGLQEVRFPLDPRDLGAPHADLRTYHVSAQVSRPGCYGFQIDGLGFTEIIVIEVVFLKSSLPS